MKHPCELVDWALDRFIWASALLMAYILAPAACAIAVWKAPVTGIPHDMLIFAALLLGLVQLATGHFWKRRNDELARQFVQQEGTQTVIYDFARLPLIPPIVVFCLGYMACALLFASFPVVALLTALWNTAPETAFHWTANRFAVFMVIVVPLQMLLWPFMQPRPLNTESTSVVRGSQYGYFEQQS